MIRTRYARGKRPCAILATRAKGERKGAIHPAPARGQKWASRASPGGPSLRGRVRTATVDTLAGWPMSIPPKKPDPSHGRTCYHGQACEGAPCRPPGIRVADSAARIERNREGLHERDSILHRRLSRMRGGGFCAFAKGFFPYLPAFRRAWLARLSSLPSLAARS